MPYILALDEGTTSARAAVYDERGRRLAMEGAPLPCRYPQPGWVEQDAEDIWLAQLEPARRVLDRANVPAGAVTAIGITNQRETTIVWDAKTGRAVAPAIVWQCRRTAEYCARLAASDHAAMITERTGLVIDAYFSASKIAWILDHVPDGRRRAADGELRFGTVDTWLIWKLTGGRVHVTDVSNASRTMLMDLEAGDWSDDLLRVFDIPRAMLPAIVPSSGVVGVTEPALFGVEIPIAGIAGDQQAALAGQACFPRGAFEKHLRHGMLRAAAYGRDHAAVEASSAGHARGLHGDRGAVRGGGKHLHRRRGGAVAAGPPGADCQRGRDRSGGDASGRYGGRLPGAGFRRAGRAVLGAHGAGPC